MKRTNVFLQQLIDLQNRVMELSANARLGELTHEEVGLLSYALGSFTGQMCHETTEPHWLVKDFNVLYASARALADACNGRGDGRPYPPLRALEAQLERLKPAFASTEETRSELAGRGGGG